MVAVERDPDLNARWNERLLAAIQSADHDAETDLAPFDGSLDSGAKEARKLLAPLVHLPRLQQIQREQLALMARSIQHAVYDKPFPSPTSPAYDVLGHLLEITGIMSAAEDRRMWYYVSQPEKAPALTRRYMNWLYDQVFKVEYVSRPSTQKRISIARAIELAQSARREGQRVVTTFGMFDFHGDHQVVVEEARRVAGDGLVIALLSSDQEADYARLGQKVEPLEQRLQKMAGSAAVSYVSEVPWSLVGGVDGAPSPKRYRAIEAALEAHFRYIGEIDQRLPLFLENAFAAGTTLVYGSPGPRGVHSRDLRAAI